MISEGSGTVYVYDVLDRIVQIKYNNTIKYQYAYNGNGDLCEVEDVANNIKYRYEFRIKLKKEGV